MAEFRIGDQTIEETKRNGVIRYTTDDFRIYQIKVESMPGHLTNVYVVLSGEASMVDVGSHMERARSDLKEGFETINRDFNEDIGLGDIANIILTHSHGDHFGMLVYDELKGKKLFIHEADIGSISDYSGTYYQWQSCTEDLAREAGYEYQPGEEGDWGPDRLVIRIADYDLIEVSDGQEFLKGYKVYHTPGHTPGHMCITRGPVVFLGDHILSSTTPHQCPKTYRPGSGLKHYMESLRKIGGIGEGLGLAGHEKLIYPVKDRAREIEEFHHQRLSELVDLCRKEMTLYEVTNEYYKRYPEVIRAPSLDHLSPIERIGALEEIKAHMEYLVDTSRVIVSGRNGQVLKYCVI